MFFLIVYVGWSADDGISTRSSWCCEECNWNEQKL